MNFKKSYNKEIVVSRTTFKIIMIVMAFIMGAIITMVVVDVNKESKVIESKTNAERFISTKEYYEIKDMGLKYEIILDKETNNKYLYNPRLGQLVPIQK